MTPKRILELLSSQKFTAEEIFFIIAYCVYKELDGITEQDIQKFIPMWHILINRRNNALKKAGSIIYDEDVNETNFLYP